MISPKRGAVGGATATGLRADSDAELAVEAFYDRLSPFYHLIYADWEASVEGHGEVLSAVIREVFGAGAREVLDAACGIGTQALGLASRGFRVAGSDVSEREIERARDEAAARGLSIPFSVADLRHLGDHHERPFDVVLACDNALPHILSDEEIAAAFRETYRCCRPGGGFVISVRDYDALELGGTQLKPYGVRTVGSTRYLVFQVWDFPVDDVYTVSMYFVSDDGDGECEAEVVRTRYYAIGIDRLMELAREAGFREVRRIDGRFFQPLVVGVRPA